MVDSVPRDFTDGLLVDDRFRAERRAAARRGAANYKNLEALAQKFWKSQEPRMPNVSRRRPVLQPISERKTHPVSTNGSDHVSTRQIFANVPVKNRVHFADGTPVNIASTEERTDFSLFEDVVNAEPMQPETSDRIHIRRSTKGLTSDPFETSSDVVSSVKSMSSEPLVTQQGSFSLQLQDVPSLKNSFQSDSDVVLGFERKRMRTYYKKSPLFSSQVGDGQYDIDTSRTSFSDSPDLSPRTVYNQRRRKIAMQFTSNNGQVTVIEPYGTGTKDPRCVEETMQRGNIDEQEDGDQDLVDPDMEIDSVKLRRENTVAVLKRIDVMLNGPDKPPVASELGSSVREADYSSESFDFSDSEVDLFLPETVEEEQTPLTYFDDPMVIARQPDSKASHEDECTSLEDIFNEPSLFSKLDVYVKCEDWLERWF